MVRLAVVQIPLISCIPYVKDWIDDHPQRANPNAHLFCGLRKNFGRMLTRHYLYDIYKHFKEDVFPRLLEDSDIPTSDKQIIQDLLKKPWNPYIQRHNAMTATAKILKESMLRVHAGWGPNSKMPQIYLHYFGNESSENLLEIYGIKTKDRQEADQLRCKQCPNCSESNKPDSRFCAKCRMVLTYDAYEETLENQKEKEEKITKMEKQMESVLMVLDNLKNQSDVNMVASTLFKAGQLKVKDQVKPQI